ncbi:MAG: biotin carboxylase N-terminal domain-containing protein [Actinomycetota bacterium]|nr:biotin carboxylase N-terminal domain-containing protein [Actinomycetota bacterium]
MPTTSRIRRILVANRGEIARRVMRTARDLGISTVAVHSDADGDALFVHEADRAVRLSGVTSAETYLDGPRIIAAALASGADAIHPGYGFLSENPGFARAVTAAGLTWIGPSPESIEAMALKVEAKRLAAAAGVPLVPGAELPDGLTDAAALAACEAVGYPLLVKASAGGGGKGMRIVTTADGLIDALAGARREAASSFGDDTVFVERYLAGARHVEVQVFGDMHGAVVHLFERECSIQRRHQKVVEESPSPGVTPAVRARLHAAGVALAEAIGYVGAGTVEFMVFGEEDEQEYYFLEMNTRLQVEHPVTEQVTGVDLVAWQIAVAQGESLPSTQEQIRLDGHAIEARLYAEDPSRDYLPATGTIHRFEAVGRRGLRIDTGVGDGSLITPHYDPMLAKVIGHAPSRAEAAAVLADGLGRMRLHGPVNNRDALVAIVRSADFLAGHTTTSFLDEHPGLLRPIICAEDEQRHAIAAALALEAHAAPADSLPLAWSNVRSAPSFVTLQRRGYDDFTTVLVDRDRIGARYRIARTPAPPFASAFALDGDSIDGATARLESEPGRRATVVIVEAGGVAARCSVATYGAEVFVDDGVHSSAWSVLPRFADHSQDAAGHGPATPVPGTVTHVAVGPGDVVVAGQTLVVLEAMKMEHRIVAEVDGVVERVLVEAGQSVDAHTVVVEFAETGHPEVTA